MGALQTSLTGRTTRNVEPLARGANRGRELTGRSSRARKSRECDAKVASTIVGSEWNLVQRALAGNADAQEQLFKTHTPGLFRTAFAVLRNKEDAEDAVQDSWYRAYRNLGSFQGRSAFSTWLTRITMNSALMRLCLLYTSPSPRD